ncbi:uncharacterized protein LOC141907569 [Tubulanus polymorphus]|uniref:uncharacterized protein LOC141907569 n=1 Tax=Tubulanus polymorphus TaxID=672921 RepID=UPI003DA5307E
MMAAASNSTLLSRNLYRQFFRHFNRMKIIFGYNRKVGVHDITAYQFLHQIFSYHSFTSMILCKGKNDAHHLGKTYLCYLESIEKYKELTKTYKGQGELSVEEAARRVGLDATPK